MSPVHFDVGVRTDTDWSLLPNVNATMVDTFRLNKPYRTFYFQSIYEKFSDLKSTILKWFSRYVTNVKDITVYPEKC